MNEEGQSLPEQPMAYQVLARKYRPKRFADVAGQDHVTVTLMNALTQQRIAHGYIFSGHRGIGKTTIARILAAALNCRNPIGSELRPNAEPCEVCESCTEIRAGNAVDVIEIDAATNRGIDEIRELRDAARYAPSRDRYKIYILDEAHQITDAAFNALLKTLEEPPDHVIFMMATTQPEDIPQTVRSRCQHFSFHAVKLVDILGELRAIAAHEQVDADEAALSLLAEAGDGSMRDALSIMDQAIASAPVTDGRARLDAQQIRELMGTVPNAVFERILEAVDQNRSAEVMTVANQLLDAGNSPAQLARQAVRYLRNCVIAKISGITPESTEGAAELLQISPDEQRRTARSAALFTEEELTRFLQTMLRTFDELGYRQEQRFHFELGLLKLVHLRRLLPVEQVLSQLSSGQASSTPRPATPRPTPTPSRPAPPPANPSPTNTFEPAKPAFSPFGADTNRKRFEGIESGHQPTPPKPTPVPTAAPVPPPIPVAAPIPVPAPTPTPSVAEVPEPLVPATPVIAIPEAPAPVAAPIAPAPVAAPIAAEIAEPAPEPITISAAAEAPSKPTPEENDPATRLQNAAVDALTAAGSQTSAADALTDATWEISEGELKIQTELSKTMLRVVINPEAEKVLRLAIRTAGSGELKLSLLPIGDKPIAEKKARAPRSGSAQAKAMEHPVVQRAQSLFHAEIRNVIDLRSDD
ncbi:DNA polymerase III subunit gamma/tau [Granulicella sibirica]|uniref:DNA polymerase III subunit gamma/tau n=1 Tax=Granulicella sibirica TaxID=2479048 RepID=A0A4Q0T0C3_9BACT|nr:DNA polymerase III subunit gamma/tau [Granulicella sibirica]RXH55780.1 DNA polymerase III subunits gamma and tau [Granulicella sibirica]